MSHISLYGLIGFSSAVNFGIHCSSQADRLCDGRVGLCGQRGHDELGVAKDGVSDLVILVEIALVDRALNDLAVGRQRREHPPLRHARADRQHEIGVAQELGRGFGRGQTGEPERQRMRFWKRALAVHGGHDRDRQRLGKLLELGPSFGPVNPAAGKEDRPACLHDHLHCDLHIGGIWAGAVRLDGRVAELARQLLLGDVFGDFDQDGPLPPGPELGEGSPHQFGHPVGHVDLGGPFRHGRQAADGLEV
jgi:hypothetical protein